MSMKCAIVTKFGSAEDVIRIDPHYPRPELKRGSNQLLVRVLACSTTPGDWRTFTGSADFFRKPKFPYIPSQDVCGIVEAIEGEAPFKVGDQVIGTWNIDSFSQFPNGGMAEYTIVDPKFAVKKPGNLNAIEGAAFSNSAVHALSILKAANIKGGERILVIGASGGIGTTLIQLLKNAGAGYVASVSTAEELMKQLGVDRNIDYSNERWWDLKEFENDKLDIVIDLADGGLTFGKCKVLKVGRKGGRFIGVGWADNQESIHKWYDFLRMMWPDVWKSLYTLVGGAFVPRYQMYMGSVTGEKLREVCDMVDDGKVKVFLDPDSPFPFTREGVAAAYTKQWSGHAHGKLVVTIADE